MQIINVNLNEISELDISSRWIFQECWFLSNSMEIKDN